MKKLVKIPTLVLMTALLLTSSLIGSGCQKKEEQQPEEATAAVYIIQNGANGIQITAEDANKMLKSFPLVENSSISVVIADGTPKVVGPVFYQNTGKNAAQIQKQEEAYLQDAIIALTSTPDSEEIDLIGSIRLASRALASSSGNKKLILAGPAITTTSPLPMAESSSLFEEDPENVASQLIGSDEQAAGSLEDVNISWYFACDVAGSQPQISQAQTNWLLRFWESYLGACGAATVQFAPDPPVGEVSTSEFQVSSIQPIETVFRFDGDSSASSPVTSGLIVLDESSVAFLPDSTTYSDPSTASETLDRLAETLQENPETTYLVAGSTALVANNSLENSQLFGLERGERVVEDLISRGVKRSQVIPIGLGTAAWSGRSNIDESYNRAVFLIPAGSEAFEEVLSVGKILEK